MFCITMHLLYLESCQCLAHSLSVIMPEEVSFLSNLWEDLEKNRIPYYGHIEGHCPTNTMVICQRKKLKLLSFAPSNT